MRNQDSRKDTDKKVAYIADDGCKDTTDKVANDFVVAKTRQNRIIGSPLTDSKIDYKTNHGIGFAIASELLDADANVIILGRREEKLKEAAKKLGERCSYYVFDVTDTAHYDELISKIEETTPIDILVNNAGINNKKDYFDFTEEELDTIIATQAKAPFLFSQAVAANMKKRKSGCILFISSLASILGMHDIQAYTLCKSGVKGLTRSLSRDLGPYGIRVNSLNPGFVYTDMLAKTNLKTPERLEEIQNRTPLRGFAKEKDLGMAAAFLCSDAARFISGIDLVVDGGISSSFLL